MPKQGSFDITLGGAIDADGKPNATATITKDGSDWVTSTTVFHTMTAEEFANFQAECNKFLTGKKLHNLNIHEVLNSYREAARFMVKMGEDAAK